ncbi:MAG: ferrochelatase [Rhodobacterales bacterium]|nr:MAG: ferrochelatase [Rhodobacterales bacterium]
MTHAAPPTASKVGILIANLGTPDGYGYWPMRRYLSEFLSDQRVIDYPKWKWQPLLQMVILKVRPFTSGKAYQSIWNMQDNESPILTITKAQTAKLQDALHARYGDQVMVDFSMRYGNPSTQSKVDQMVQAGCDKILFFPLYPQYAGPTTATANDAFFKALSQEKIQPTARTVAAYYQEPLFIEALAQSIERAYAEMDTRPDLLVASYHGMPKRYIAEGDPYLEHCQQTTQLLRERLGWGENQLVMTFQSQFGPEDWLRPYTVEEVARLAEQGKKNIAVFAPAFSADCIETLEEINEEIKDSFEEAGGEKFTYIPCLNDDPAHIAALAKIIEDNLGGWLD